MKFLEYLGSGWVIQIFKDKGLIILRANRGDETRCFVLKHENENKFEIDCITYLTKEQRKDLPVPEDYSKASFEELQEVRKWYGSVSFEVFPFSNRQEIYGEYWRKYLAKKRGNGTR